MPTVSFAEAGAARASTRARVRRAVRVTRRSKAFGSGKLRYALGRRHGQLGRIGLGLTRAPLGLGGDGARDDAIAMTLDCGEHRAYELLAEIVRLEPQLAQLGVRRVVVVLLLLDARVVEVLDLDLVAELGARPLRELGELEHGELLRELVEHAELAALRRVAHGQLDALERVADVEEAARLPALAVDGERVPDHGLHAEAVERGAEDLVVVEARAQALVERGLLGLDPVHDALVEVGRAQAPDAAGEVDVVRV